MKIVPLAQPDPWPSRPGDSNSASRRLREGEARPARSKPWRLVLAGVIGLVLAGCQHTSESPRSRPELKTEASAYVAIPPDAWSKKDLIFDSGKLTALAVRDAFAVYLRHAFLARHVETLEESLATARQGGCTYLVYPSVLSWEDHATELTGRRDKIEIKIQVLAAATGEVLDSVVLRARSRWLNDGGDVPQDLLREPVKKYVAGLFHPTYVPSALQ